MKFSHLTASFLLFGTLLGLLTFIYGGMVENYDITKGDLQNMSVRDQATGLNSTSEGNIADQLTRMNLLKGLNKLQNGFLELTSINSFADVVGGVLMAGLGILQTIYGLFLAPFDISAIILGFYAGEIPGIIGGLAAMILFYGGWIVLSLKTGKDL